MEHNTIHNYIYGFCPAVNLDRLQILILEFGIPGKYIISHIHKDIRATGYVGSFFAFAIENKPTKKLTDYFESICQEVTYMENKTLYDIINKNFLEAAIKNKNRSYKY